MQSAPPDQKTLRAFLERRHPEYAANLAHWNFLDATYEGGREWFADNVFRYIKEGDKEFKDRLARAYRFNHTKEIVDLISKYIFKAPIRRNTDDAPTEIRDFWDNATLHGLTIDQYMKLLGQRASTLGRIWVFVDNNKGEEVVTRADEKKAGARCYSYFVPPQDVLDLGFDENTGELTWILVRETARDDKDPIHASGDVRERWRLWTTESWHLFEIRKVGRKEMIVVAAEAEHPVGRVPCFAVDHLLGTNRYVAPAMIADIAYLDRAVANYCSNLDAIIQDQTFSQLAMPAQGLLPGDDKYDKLLEMGTKRVFLYDGEGGSQPFYLTPDVKQAQIVLQVINKIISEIYHSVGMAGERTKSDNATGIDNSSGVAKAYDFERLNSLLAAKADTLDRAENQLIELVEAWHGKPLPDQDLVKYADTFDVRGLYDEFDIAMRLSLIEAPDAMRRHQMTQVVDKLWPTLAEDLKAAMLAELQDWPPQLDELGAPLGMTSATAGGRTKGSVQQQEQPAKSAGAAPSPAKNKGDRNRQGQVTRNTA
ncbi:phage portal protein [Azospirillum argentinense]|uniref:phage portal protein n=1 Tax=Azospirillum argentinense TaxID=2970906 RepID=UPI0032DF700C